MGKHGTFLITAPLTLQLFDQSELTLMPFFDLHVFRAAVSSYLSSLHTFELHIQVHQLCTNNKHNTYLDPPLGGFGWKA